MSQIVGTKGEILYRATGNREVLKIIDIDPKRALDKKVTKYNDVIKDRFPNLYHKLIK